MGKSELLSASRRLRKAAGQAYLKEDRLIKENLRGTPLYGDYVSKVNQYRPDACADALGDLATELDKLARKTTRARRRR